MMVYRYRRVAMPAVTLLLVFSLPVFAGQTKPRPQKNANANAARSQSKSKAPATVKPQAAAEKSKPSSRAGATLFVVAQTAAGTHIERSDTPDEETDR